jgi:hypothetical protein
MTMMQVHWVFEEALREEYPINRGLTYDFFRYRNGKRGAAMMAHTPLNLYILFSYFFFLPPL